MPAELREVVSPDCYGGKTSEPACAVVDADDSGADVVVNSYMARYSPVYYFVAGGVIRLALDLGFGVVSSIVLARFVSGVISFGMIAVASILLGRRFGSVVSTIVVAAAITPQTLFLGASVNPNGFEVGASLLFAAAIASLFHDVHDSERVGVGLAWWLLIGGFCLAMARPASVVWFCGLAMLLFIPVNRRPVLWRIPAFAKVGLLITFLLSAASFLYLNSGREAGASGNDLTDWQNLPLIYRGVLILLKFGELVRQGYGLLGWADTWMPALFLIMWIVVVVWAVSRMSVSRERPVLRARWSFVFLLVCALAVAVQSDLAGFGWQGRYILPCLVAALALLAPGMAHSCLAASSQRLTAIVTAGIVAILDFGAIAINLGRYLYGYTELRIRFDQLPVPQPDGTWVSVLGRFTPLVLAGIGTLTVLGLVVSQVRGAREQTVAGSSSLARQS